VLALNLLNNTQGQTQAVTKVLRALARSPGLAQRVLGASRAIALEDGLTGKVEQTLAFSPDDKRLSSAFEHIARALHFHHFHERWPGSVQTFAEFLVVIGPPDSVKRNQHLQDSREAAGRLFDGAAKHGQNQDIFFYQLFEDPTQVGRRFMRLTFYGGTRALALFLPEGVQLRDIAFD